MAIRVVPTFRGSHQHRCFECACAWDCQNAFCLDLEGKWCANHCAECAKPPAYLEHLEQVQEAREDLRHAVHLLTEADERDLARAVEGLVDLIQGRAEERSRGVSGV